MIRHLLTGQVVRAIRSGYLPLLSLLLLSLALPAQNGGSPAATVGTNTRSPDDDEKGAAHPAPEPDTWLLLGTGAVVLLLLYTRRRVRLVAPPATQHQT